MLNTNPLRLFCLISIAWAANAFAFDSGSTGADGDFAPVSDVTLSLPENGIFNFTTVNIPEGVTVKFTTNALNTAAIMLVQGDAVIDGTIDISGIDGGTFFVTTPPAAFRGGAGAPPESDGFNGLGPGGGRGGIKSALGHICGGSGAGFGTDSIPDFVNNNCIVAVDTGLSYGSSLLQPLLGGSGGGSGLNTSASTYQFSGMGGTGGGALLIAVSSTLTLNGSILAKGGAGENKAVSSLSAGGGGSGGGLRLVASTFSGQGTINIEGGAKGTNSSSNSGSSGGAGRLRIEADSITFNGTVIPSNGLASTGTPSALFFANIPTIRITSIAGRSVPQFPSGENDVFLPSDTTNPVSIEIATTQVPVGDSVRLTVIPRSAAVINVNSSALVGTSDNATATVDVDLPTGASVLTASVSFAPTLAQGNNLAQLTGGEVVKRVELASSLGAGSETILITASGKRYAWDGSRTQRVN